jgi:molybdate transport system substrate-binding protein
VAKSGFSSRRSARIVALGLLCLGRAGTAHADDAGRREEVSVFAAVSLADALTEIGSAWQAATGHRAVFNFETSSDLARQILAGAPAEVFFSADEVQMDVLQQQGLVRAGERHDLLSNTLVVVVPVDSTARVKSPRDLAAFAHIAVADPQAVPAGVYARSWLVGLGLWDALAPRVVPTLHVRAALAAVESGNAEAGIVYRTDAARSTRARVAFEVEPSQGPPIRYPLAPLAASGRKAVAAFVDYLRGSVARTVFVRHGFLVLRGH